MSTHRDVTPTIGAIARKLGELHPSCRVRRSYAPGDRARVFGSGNDIRVFAPDAVDRVADALREIDRQKTTQLARRPEGVET